ncbi:hypothetical protein ABW19_dt0200771 [Dactylella cylindrospora]|nr:hypothetical protein ABW19_dt0200771 [Dactylella cylindrospora]
MADNNGPRGYRDGLYFVDVNAYVLPPLIGLPYHDMRLNGEGARHRGDTRYYRLIVVHAVFMCLAILLCIPFGIFTARFRAYKNPRRAIRTHIYSNIFTIVFLTIGFACGYIATTGQRAWTNPHHIIGLTIYSAIMLQALLGVIVHQRGKYRVTPHLPLRTMLHRWLGRAIWLLGLAQIPLGLTLYGSPLSLFVLYAIYMFSLLILYFVSEFYRGRQHGTATVTTETGYDYYSDKPAPAEKKGWFSMGNIAKVGLGLFAAKKVKDHYTKDDRTLEPSDLSSRPGPSHGGGSRRHTSGYDSSVGITNSELNGGYNRTELTDYTRTEDLESRMTPPRASHGHSGAAGAAAAAAGTGLLAGYLASGGKNKGVDTRPISPSARAKPGWFSGLFQRNKGIDLSMGASPKKPRKTGGLTGDGGWFDRHRRNRGDRAGMSAVHTEDYSDSDDDSRRRDGSPVRRGGHRGLATAAAVGAGAGLAAAHHRDRRNSISPSDDSYMFSDAGRPERASMPATGGLQAPPPAQNSSSYSNHRLPIASGAPPGSGGAFDSPQNIHNDNPMPAYVVPQIPGVPPVPVPMPMPSGGGGYHSRGSSRSRQDSVTPPPAGLGIKGTGVSGPGDHSDSELTIEPKNRPAGSRSYRIPQTVTSGSEAGYQSVDSQGFMPQASLQVRIKKQEGGKTVTTIKRIPNRERGSMDMSGGSPSVGRRNSRSGDRSRRDSDYRVREEKRRSDSQDRHWRGGAGDVDHGSDNDLKMEREARRERRRQKRENPDYSTGGESPRPTYT